MSTQSPVRLELVASLIGDTVLEMRLHAKFLHSRVNGEWFAWTPELQAVIDSVIAGSFNADTLPPPRGLPKPPRKPWTDEQKAAARARNIENAAASLSKDVALTRNAA